MSQTRLNIAQLRAKGPNNIATDEEIDDAIKGHLLQNNPHHQYVQTHVLADLEKKDNKGLPGGYVPLDDNGLIAISFIPSQVSANGVASVNNLKGDVIITPETINAINVNKIATANGVASLGANGLVPKNQLPSLQTNLSAAFSINPMSGTTIIPLDNSTPSVNEGVAIASQLYSPSDTGSKMTIEGVITVDCSSNNKQMVITVFRDSTCIGATVMNFLSSGKPQPFPFFFLDSSMGSYFGSSVRYTVRFGLATPSTWHINKSNSSSYFNGLLANNSIRFSEFL